MSEELRHTTVEGIKCYNSEKIRSYTDYPIDGFDLTEKLENESFWVRSRNRLFKKIVLRNSFRNRKTRFFEIGCGTGSFISEIVEHKNLIITGSEIYLRGLLYAKKKLPGVEFIQFDVTKGKIAKKFDIVAAFDVLEHVDNDKMAIFNINQMLRVGGYFIVTVPQYMFLWSRLDEIIKHKRRYSRKELVSKLQHKGFTISYCSSFLFILFPLMLISRIFDQHKEMKSSETEFENRVVFPKILNWIFDKCMRLDEFLIEKGVSLPFGGTLLVVAKKTNTKK